MNIPETILAGMRKTNDLFCTTVVGHRDVDALDHVYTKDARILPPGAEMIDNLAAIKQFWLQAITGLNVTGASLTTVSAEQAGDTVVEIGQAELTLAGGQLVPIKYVVHWKLEDSAWKWHIDIWNMNQ